MSGQAYKPGLSLNLGLCLKPFGAAELYLELKPRFVLHLSGLFIWKEEKYPKSFSVNIITASLDIMALGKVWVIVQIYEIPH